MKKIILVPDSFKGSMSSGEICVIMESVIKSHLPDAEVISMPVADGGEGSVDAFLAAAGGKKVAVTVKGPYFEDIRSFYGVLPDNTAVVEMAAAAGLPLVGDRKNPEKTTTFGVGQLIAHAVRAGCKKIIVCLGGSATNDGGTGAAAALGVRFSDSYGNTFIPVGETLSRISSIDLTDIGADLSGVEFITMCDIDNPLYGPQGAAAVFAPQKGADRAMVQILDDNLAHLAKVIKKDLGADIAGLPGAGAAGGMGGGMVAFLKSPLKMGIETVLDTVNFNRVLEGADLVITGEGRLDGQSLRGKAVIGVARRAKKAGVPLIAVVGDIGDNIGKAYEEGVSAVFSINRSPVPLKEAILNSKTNLELTMDNLMRLVLVFGQHIV